MKKEETMLDDLITMAQRQRFLRDEYYSHQRSLAHEVASADVKGHLHVARLARLAVTAVLLVGPSLLMSAYTSVPDGRSMRTQLDRTQVLHDANLLITKL